MVNAKLFEYRKNLRFQLRVKMVECIIRIQRFIRLCISGALPVDNHFPIVHTRSGPPHMVSSEITMNFVGEFHSEDGV